MTKAQDTPTTAAKSLTRRAILAGAAALPALTVIPATALSAADADPIFAAIAKHKAAYLLTMQTGDVQCSTADAAPEYEAAHAAQTVAIDASDEAASALTTIRPTTVGGLVDLLKYIEQFNAGGFALDTDPYNWHSAAAFWPADTSDDDIQLFGYSVLANVRRALETLAVQS